MKRVWKFKNDGPPICLDECPPGAFIFNGRLGFKSEYRTDGRVDAYSEAGEYFWAGYSRENVGKVIVQPIVLV